MFICITVRCLLVFSRLVFLEIMNQYRTEKWLCFLYSVLALSLGVAIICIAVPYTHWRETLDKCPSSWLENSNCGCIFYGVSTYRNFNGGHNSYCLYAILAPIPVLIYAVVMALFHMYRVCIDNIGKYEDKNSTVMEEIEGQSIVVSSRTRVSQSTDSVIYCWIPSSCIAAIFCIYNLAHSALITDGFLKTCTQYRSNLVGNEFQATGDQATAIHYRLSCQAIFDFMDYIQKDAPNSRRGNYINTGIALQIALFASWLAVVLWIVTVVLTARRAYRERDVMTCCGN